MQALKTVAQGSGFFKVADPDWHWVSSVTEVHGQVMLVAELVARTFTNIMFSDICCIFNSKKGSTTHLLERDQLAQFHLLCGNTHTTVYWAYCIAAFWLLLWGGYYNEKVQINDSNQVLWPFLYQGRFPTWAKTASGICIVTRETHLLHSKNSTHFLF